MKIKQTRQVRLDELLQLVWSNKFDYLVFMSDNNNFIDFDTNGMIRQAYGIKPDDLFTITEEIEITEDTILDRFVHVLDSGRTKDVKNSSISKSINFFGSTVKFIYLQNEDGSIGDLIWKDGKLIE